MLCQTDTHCGLEEAVASSSRSEITDSGRASRFEGTLFYYCYGISKRLPTHPSRLRVTQEPRRAYSVVRRACVKRFAIAFTSHRMFPSELMPYNAQADSDRTREGNFYLRHLIASRNREIESLFLLRSSAPIKPSKPSIRAFLLYNLRLLIINEKQKASRKSTS